ncbi:SDR family oxidoreductase [Pseudovibrio exalbescens]|uniref:SDR family oxidoreductase n=1 Tax=Pseudovibrio exalbescens TaxID=197461 RepID=UPI002366F160|nr:SDR family oxidoreductase [Pseudovibrio exalbescens]MDD7909853.1 SDR family oxidoreductase [Pseudovibrio exalbescens]
MSAVEGKRVIITGASRGIGEAAARLLAEQGAKVVLAARGGEAIKKIAEEIVAAGGEASAFPCDVSSYTAVAALVKHTVDTFGGVDVLVNNAGVIEPIAPLIESDPEEWAKVVDINIKGVYYGMRAAAPEMLKVGGGTIINISSGAAYAPLDGWSQYCTTKAGALMLTRSGHKELGDKGIRVVGLSPGTVATEMQVAIKSSGINPVSKLDFSVHIPAEWVAKTIAFLMGPGGDEYLGSDFSLKTNEGRMAVGFPGLDG